MKVALGADHAGYLMKNELVARLRAQGHEVQDLGTFSGESTDYPDYAQAVASRVSNTQADFGILICSTGIGMSIAANKLPGIRAAVGMSDEEVRLSRTHNNANILAVGANFTDQESANRWVDIFLNSGFDDGRHGRRVSKIAAIEAKTGAEHLTESA